MAEDKKQQGNENSQKRNEENKRSRIDNSQSPAWEQKNAQRDISDIDQQEGNMEHGEKGGNFNERKENS